MFKNHVNLLSIEPIKIAKTIFQSEKNHNDFINLLDKFSLFKKNRYNCLKV